MAEDRKLTYEEVLQGLRGVVAGYPADYVYTTDSVGGQCNYWDRKNECPSCLIGVYLHSIGYDAEVLADLDDEIDPAWSANPQYLHRGFTGKANELMVQAQHHQDRDATWVSAVNKAQATVEGHTYNDNEERTP